MMKRGWMQISFVAVLMLAGGAKAQESKWVGTWAASPVGGSTKVDKSLTLGTAEMTVRETVHLTAGGKKLRVTLSNEFGTEPLTVSDAHVALLSSGADINVGMDHALLFGGKGSVTIAPGQFLASDALMLSVPSFSDVTISLCLPAQTMPNVTMHSLSVATTYFGMGDQTAAASMVVAGKILHWYLLKDIQVDAEKKSAAVVTFGDSITDGARSTPDANHRWPDVLAKRLAGDKKTKELSVLNEGISGNRILHDVTGPAAVDRLDRDVINAPGVKYVLWLEGINDIGHADIPKVDDDRVTAEQIIAGMKDGVARMRAKGIKVIGCTLTPFVGAGYATPNGEAMRQAVNTFIRTAGSFDGVVDFDRATQDPQQPDRFLKSYESGDHLHPSDAGYEVMGDAIDLKLFQ